MVYPTSDYSLIHRPDTPHDAHGTSRVFKQGIGPNMRLHFISPTNYPNCITTCSTQHSTLNHGNVQVNIEERTNIFNTVINNPSRGYNAYKYDFIDVVGDEINNSRHKHCAIIVGCPRNVARFDNHSLVVSISESSDGLCVALFDADIRTPLHQKDALKSATPRRSKATTKDSYAMVEKAILISNAKQGEKIKHNIEPKYAKYIAATFRQLLI